MNNWEQLIGQVLDRRYQIVRSVGSGGMSVVFEAVDLMNNRTVAVKILKDEMASDMQAVRRFINESKAVSLLSHPGIVRIYDVVIRRDLKYIVMEYVQGITLKKYMEKKGPLTMQEILSYSEQILRALAHAHSKGIIHRDIKPQNILLLKNGRIKVADFGIAKLPNAETVTMNDKAIGTVYYISPEQASGKPIDPRSDLYSLGVCMYEMATGTLPFIADSPVSVALMQVNDTPRPPREIVPSIPFGLEQIILGAMEKDPNRRFQDATQMLRHVMQLRTDPAFVFRMRRVKRGDADRHPVPAGQADPNPKGGREEYRNVLDPKAVKKNPMKKRKKQSTSMFPIIAGVAVAFLMVCIVCAYVLISALLRMQQESRPITLTVPELLGEVYSAPLLAEYDDSLYQFELIYLPSDEYAVNTIIEQDPKPGTERKVQANVSRCLVKLTISCEVGAVMLPDLTIMDHREAEQKLKAMGMVAKEEEEYHPTIDSGMVIRTSPVAGTPLKAGDEVTLHVSRGPDIEIISVPNFIGMTTAEAYAAMGNGKTLQAGFLSYAYSDVYGAGRIVEQSVLANSSVVSGTTIDFVISLGKKAVQIAVPNFVGLTTEEAGALLNDSDGNPLFTLGTVTHETSETIPAGSVIWQSIAEGTMVDSGTVIDFIVSMGPSSETTDPADTTDPSGGDAETTGPSNTVNGADYLQ